MSKKLTIDEVVDTYLDLINEGDPEAYFHSRTLLSMYVYYENMGKTPHALKKWVMDRLLEIGDGKSADAAFSLLPGAGHKHTKLLHNQLRCVCFVTLKMREGMGKSGAVEACVKEFGTAERHIYRFLQGIEIGGNVSDNTLIFFRDIDVSGDYSFY